MGGLWDNGGLATSTCRCVCQLHCAAIAALPHRLRSMSFKALLQRMWKITNRGKLESLCAVLEAAGDGRTVELLDAARDALAQL